MKYRVLGKSKYKVSEIGFGAWAIGGSWGKVSKADARSSLEEAYNQGINFFDTADVYGDGRSEKIIGEFIKGKKEVVVATKIGRRLKPHVAEKYEGKVLEKHIDRSLKNLDVEALDLVQLHTPPTQVFYKPEIFEFLDKMKKKGKIKHYGVSVEKVEEGIKALEYPGVTSVQIIFNIFRQRPAELFFEMAAAHEVGLIIRVPLVSGLLTGKFNKSTKFSEDDHRKFNREGEAFDKGETFSGVDYEKGLKAVEKLKRIKPKDITMAQFALAFILQFKEVSTVIAGAKNEEQVQDNADSSGVKLGDRVLRDVKLIYEQDIKELVHQRW